MVRKKGLISLVLAVSLLLSGCAAVVVGAAAGGAAVGWFKGNLVDQVNVGVPKAFIAAKAGLRDLKLPILEEKYDSIKGVLKSQLADGKKVSVSLKATQGGTTQITIRVGIIGEQSSSYRILNAIKSHL